MSTEIHDRDTEQLEKVKQAVRDYHYALDNREHGVLAAGALVSQVQVALGMPWQPGDEKVRRAVYVNLI